MQNIDLIKEFVNNSLKSNRSYDFFINWENIDEVSENSIEFFNKLRRFYK